MNFFHHKDLGNYLLQLYPKVVKHPVCSLSHIVSLSNQGLCMLHAQPLVACVGTYNVVWWCFNLFICGGWDLEMQATEYKCKFPSDSVDLYTDAWTV